MDETPDSTPPSSRKPDAWELVCSGILRTEFGRRPSRAVSNAMVRLAAEEAASGKTPVAAHPAGWLAKIHHWLSSLPPRPAFGLAAALLLMTGASVYFLKSHFAEQDAQSASLAGCKLSNAQAMRWANDSAALKIGDEMPLKTLRLESGVVEITFASSAKVAIEGPAQFRLTSGNSIELESGKIATDVPRRARGFVLKTPTATVADLGTRFGTIIGADKSSEVDVFQGRIKLTTDSKENPAGWRLTAGMAMFVDERGATPADALPELAFPQPEINMEVRPQNCGFDVSGRTTVGEVPTDFGYWSGLSYALTAATEEVKPANGPGMLEFSNPSAPHTGDSEVFQVIDLRPYKPLLASGQVEAKLSALFNRVAGDAGVANKFGLTLAAFRGSPADAKTLWAGRGTMALALADKELTSDDKPETWESLEAAAKLPPETDFVIVQIRAMVPKGNPGASLAGHFADLVDLRLSTPMRASSIAIK
ncbi:MAG TPA: FecR family protein [Candidatus Acidoferrales bacterium]|jgi:hypothetical protein|nr:FecR family protein [Candidatus Acidoferrales bacterium]